MIEKTWYMLIEAKTPYMYKMPKHGLWMWKEITVFSKGKRIKQ